MKIIEGLNTFLLKNVNMIPDYKFSVYANFLQMPEKATIMTFMLI